MKSDISLHCCKQTIHIIKPLLKVSNGVFHHSVYYHRCYIIGFNLVKLYALLGYACMFVLVWQPNTNYMARYSIRSYRYIELYESSVEAIRYQLHQEINMYHTCQHCILFLEYTQLIIYVTYVIFLVVHESPISYIISNV